MSIVSDEEYEAMNPVELKDYCNWCFYHDYGNCDYCAIEKHKSRQPKEKREGV
jgi:hypothetical protein